MNNSNLISFYRLQALMLVLVLCVFTSDIMASEDVTYISYYRVSGVASNDVLNVRSGPNASYATVGSLAPNAAPVEVFRQQDGWAQVALSEQMGWVSMRFLAEISIPTIGSSTLPQGLTCGGTEPFWGLDLGAGQVTYSAMDQSPRAFNTIQADKFHNLGGSTNFVLGQRPNEQITAIISNQMCSDGMSDRDYPRRIDLLISTPNGTTGQSGCCQVRLN